MLAGGDDAKCCQRSAVMSALCLLDLLDHAMNAARPSALPLVARQVAIPIRFQLAQPRSSFGMTASAAITNAASASGLLPAARLRSGSRRSSGHGGNAARSEPSAQV